MLVGWLLHITSLSAIVQLHYDSKTLIIFVINIINITEKMDMEICTNDLLFALAFH
jgi:hypothetical protein